MREHFYIESLKQQREALKSLYRQADEFLNLYEDLLDEDSKDIMKRFAKMNQYNFLTKRKVLLQGGYLKTGFSRNIALMIIV